tara:strand:- start:6115 stop:6582 length:468 start_codon:yes stop_codon:yes gene_type:complete
MSSLRAAPFGTKRRRAVVILLTISLMIGIAILTLTPLNVPAGAPGSDKIHHLLEFAALTLPCAVLYPKALLKVVLAAAVFGTAIEVIQPYVGRQGELTDFIANLLGVGIGATLGLLLNFAFAARIMRRLASCWRIQVLVRTYGSPTVRERVSRLV